jgi:hypothetical protein
MHIWVPTLVTAFSRFSWTLGFYLPNCQAGSHLTLTFYFSPPNYIKKTRSCSCTSSYKYDLTTDCGEDSVPSTSSIVALHGHHSDCSNNTISVLQSAGRCMTTAVLLLSVLQLFLSKRSVCHNIMLSSLWAYKMCPVYLTSLLFKFSLMFVGGYNICVE